MAGTIGVVNGVAMYTGDGINDANYYINVGGINFSNLRTQMRVVAVESGTNAAGVALRFRQSDESNYWEFGHDLTTTTYVLRKKVGGVFFTMAEPGVVKGDGDVIKVEAYEERINCYVNNTLVSTIQDTDLSENTNVGMRFSAACVDSAVDDFYALELLDDIRENLGTALEYEVFVDWDNDGGFAFGDFEIAENLEAWTTFGSNPPLIEQSQQYYRSGNYAMHVSWRNWNLFQFNVIGHGFSQGTFGGPEYENPQLPFKFAQSGQGFDDGYFAVSKDQAQPDTSDPVYVSPGVFRTIEDLIPGRSYDLIMWVYVPSFSDPVTIGVEGISGSTTSTLVNQWEKLVYTYEATDDTHNIRLYSSSTNPANNTDCWVDEVMNLGAYEDISCYVIMNRGDIDFREGRDQARSLASISPGDVSLELDNSTQIFSPDNNGGVLYQYLSPGKPMMIRATYNDNVVNLFHGFVDNYVLNPQREDLSVTMSCMDALQWLANTTLSTELYPSIQTGEAINAVLDVAGWPEDKRDIDQGATTVRWWWEEGTNGLEAIQNLVESEGLPANAFVDAYGNFVFRSRHHRFLLRNSKATQVTVRSCVEFDEPNFSAPVTYDIGWKDIINKIDIDVDERLPIPFDEVWTSPDDELVTVAANDTYTITAKPSDPFFNASIPSVADGTIVLQYGSGDITSVNIDKTSGQSATITIQAGGTDVVIKKISMKASSVPVFHTKKVVDENSSSVAKYGPQTNQNSDFKWTGINDMRSISTLILGQRSERLPVVFITLNNGNPVRISNILNRSLSDRIHLVEELQTFMNDDYFIEVLEHNISKSGTFHSLSIGCEKARDQLITGDEGIDVPTFTFDDPTKGFNDGYFSKQVANFTSSDSLFILDQSLLDTDGLGY